MTAPNGEKTVKGHISDRIGESLTVGKCWTKDLVSDPTNTLQVIRSERDEDKLYMLKGN